MRDDPELDIIRKRGFQHEARYLADLARRRPARRRDRRSTARSTDRGEQLRAAAAATIEAMAAGADVIYQATFFDGTWRGHADFLLRVDDARAPVASGGRTTTRSPTPSSRATSRPARSSRSARTSTSSSGSRASGRSGCTSRSAAAPATVERLRVDDYMAYYRERQATASWRRWPTTTPADLPAGRHLPGARRALRRLPLGGRMRRPAPRRRPPQPGRRDLRRASAGP